MKKKERKDPFRRQVYVTDEEWFGVDPILREVGLTRSKFITLCFRWLIRSKDRTLAEVQGGLFQELFQAAEKVGKVEPSPQAKAKT